MDAAPDPTPLRWRAPLPPPDERWALLLDVDGTLVDFADRPDDVVVPSALRRLLHRLAGCCDGALALVSGRSIVDVDRLLHPFTFPTAGQHGLERRDAGGRIHRQAGVDGVALATAATRLRRFEARHPGVLLEHKGASLALHYRMAPDCGPLVEFCMQRLADELGARFEIAHGKMVVELRPAGQNKGTAIGEFLREPPFAGRVPVFVGDDRTDEYGFARVNRRGGHSIKVGAGPSSAVWRLPDAPAVRRWLIRLARSVR